MAALPKKENMMHTHPAKMCITDTCKRPLSAGRRRNKLPKVLTAPRTAPSGISSARCGADSMVMSPSIDAGRGFSAGAGELSSCMDEIMKEAMMGPPQKKARDIFRDKESLVEEIYNLKTALADQGCHFKLHQVHHRSMNMENRRLELEITNLETQNGYEAPRTGGKSRLRSKLLGCKTKLLELQSIFEIQREELIELNKDGKVSLTYEAQVERDMFAAEVQRLQKELRKLHHLHHKIIAGNAEVARLRTLIHGLDLRKQQLEQTISSYKESLEQKRKEIQMWKATGEAAMEDAKRHGQRLAELEEHSQVLQGLLDRERVEKRRLEKRTRLLEEDIRRLDKEAEAQRLRDALAKAKRDAKARRNKLKKGTKKTSKDKGKLSAKDSSSAASSPKNPADGIAQFFLKEVKVATHRFIEDAPASKPGSPKTPASKAGGGGSAGTPAGGGSAGTPAGGGSAGTPAGGAGSPMSSGDQEQHRSFEGIRTKFTRKVDEAENQFLKKMEEMEYGEAGRPAGSAEEEAKLKSEEDSRRLAEEKLKSAQLEVERLLAELEALKKAHMVPPGGKRWQKENLTILVDDKDLPPSEYTSEIQDQGTEISIHVAIRSPTSEADEARMRAEEAMDAMRRKAEEDEARRKLEEEEARRKAEEDAHKKNEDEEALRKQHEEEEAKRKAEEEEAKKKSDAEEARKRMEEDARRKQEQEAKNKSNAEEARKRMEEDTRRKQEQEAKNKSDAEEARKRMEEEARRRKAEEEEAARRKAEADRKDAEEDAEAARRKAEADRKDAEEDAEAARRKAEMEAHNKKLQGELAEANRKAAEEEAEAAKRKASMEARNKKLQDELEAAKRRAAEEEAKRKAAAASSSSGGQGFFDAEMHGVIKDNIKEVLGHLETISDVVQKKADEEVDASAAAASAGASAASPK